jgi:hypothetical protein
VKLARIGNEIFLYDGFHTLEAIRTDGRKVTVDAQVLNATDLTFREVRYLAHAANDNHGKALDDRERFEMFRSYIEAGLYRKGELRVAKSYAEMAKDLSRSKALIFKWMNKHYPTIAREMATRGEVFKPNTGGHRDMAKKTTLEELKTKLEGAVADIRLLTAIDAEEGEAQRVSALFLFRDLMKQLESKVTVESVEEGF